MNKDILVQKFQQALSYEDFVASGAAEGHDKTWNQRYARISHLTSHTLARDLRQTF